MKIPVFSRRTSIQTWKIEIEGEREEKSRKKLHEKKFFDYFVSPGKYFSTFRLLSK